MDHRRRSGTGSQKDFHAQVVKKIFTLCMNGRGPSQIAEQLEREKILTPTAYKTKQGVKTPHTEPENPYRWYESTIVNILERKEYIGATVNFKTYTNSIWDKKQRENPEENRVIFYNTHPAIIEQESLTRYRKFVSSDTGEPQQARAVRFRDWCSVLIASRSSTIPPPSTLKSDRTFLSVPLTVPTRTSAVDTIFVP